MENKTNKELISDMSDCYWVLSSVSSLLNAVHCSVESGMERQETLDALFGIEALTRLANEKLGNI